MVNGCLHWITTSHEDEGFPLKEGGSPVIVSFHLGVEEFGFVPTPESHLLKYPYYQYALGELEGCLSLGECSSEPCFKVWVMNKYNDKDSWVKQFSIEHDSLCRVVGSLSKYKYVEFLKVNRDGEVLLVCGRWCVGNNMAQLFTSFTEGEICIHNLQEQSLSTLYLLQGIACNGVENVSSNSKRVGSGMSAGEEDSPSTSSKCSSKKLKLHSKPFIDCFVVDHAKVPRKLRSRHRVICKVDRVVEYMNFELPEEVGFASLSWNMLPTSKALPV
ncbi:hypothetical protein IFM89_019504 [Coptis chinensis]|uniref:F-box associated beta-propeller type 3 domain-containing protein n=1 Tax=Coptis chinensis TaxID=261450 RepID=A0A835HFN3_9MAGN|nr:hypothetical protein IFM89_019504 [Coptis chinensis]